MKLFNLFGTIGLDTSKFEQGIEQSTAQGRGFGETMVAAGAAVAKAAAAIGTAVLGIGTMSVKAGMKFDDKIQGIAARTGMTTEEMQKLERSFRDLALTGRASVFDLAGAFYKVSLAGMDYANTMYLVNAAMVFSEAQGISLAKAMKMLGGYLDKLDVPLRYAYRYANLFTEALNHTSMSSTNMQKYLYDTVAAVNGLGMSSYEATAVITALYNAGMRGARIYSGFGEMMHLVTNATDEQRYALDRLNVDLVDYYGNRRDGIDVLRDLGRALEDVGDEYRAYYKGLLQVTQMGDFFLQGLSEQHENIGELVPVFREAFEAVYGTGAAFEGAAQRAGGLGQAFGVFRNGVTDVKLELFRLIEVPLTGFLEKGAAKFQELIDRITKGDLKGLLERLAGAFMQIVERLFELTMALLPIVLEWLPKLVEWFLKALDVVSPFIPYLAALYIGFKKLKIIEVVKRLMGGLSTAFSVFGAILKGKEGVKALTAYKKGVEAVTKAKTALTRAKGALKIAFKALTGPIGIVIGVIAAVTAAVVYLWRNNEEFREAVLKIWERIKEIFIAVIDFLKPLFRNWLDHMLEIWRILWDTITTVLQAAWDMVIGIVENAVGILLGIVNVVASLITRDWEGLWDGLVSIARNFLGILETVLSGVWDIGKNLVIGLWNGIKSHISWIGDNISNFASNMMDRVRNIFGINSPSRRFMEIGRQVGDGLFIGLQSLNSSVNVTRRYGERIVEAGEQTARSFYRLTSASLAMIPDMYRKSKEQSLRIVEAWGVSEKDRTKQRQKFISEINHLTLTQSLELLETLSEANKLSANEEIALLEHLLENHRMSAKQREELETQLVEAQARLRQESFNHSREWIEKQLELGKMTAQEEIEAWERVVQRHVEGSAERLEAEEILAQRRDQLNRDQMEALAEMERLEQAYIDAVDNRTQALLNTFDMFREINLSETNVDRAREAITRAEEAYARAREELTRIKTSMQQAEQSSESMARYQERLTTAQKSVQTAHEELTEAIHYGSRSQAAVMADNLQGQIDNMQEWETQMQMLSQRGIEEGLIEHFRKLGPTTTRYLQQLNQSSDQELTRLGELYRLKHEEARRLAVNELQGLREDTNTQIASILGDLKATMSSDTHPIGQNMIQGIMQGAENMSGALSGTLQSIVQNAVNAAKSTLGINSPSKVFMELGEYSTDGFIQGFKDLAKEVKKIWEDVKLELAPIAYSPNTANATNTAGQHTPTAPTIQIYNNWYVEGNPSEIDMEKVREINRLQRQEQQDVLRSGGWGGVY